METQKVLWASVPVALAVVAMLAGCGKNCGDEARLGDFEFSQGNLPNATKHYERALQIDSACGGGRIREKLAEISRRM